MTTASVRAKRLKPTQRKFLLQPHEVELFWLFPNSGVDLSHVYHHSASQYHPYCNVSYSLYISKTQLDAQLATPSAL